MNYLTRFYYSVLGGHTHIAVFVGRDSRSADDVDELPAGLGKAGNLILRNEEFEAFKNSIVDPFTVSAHGHMRFQFVESREIRS